MKRILIFFLYAIGAVILFAVIYFAADAILSRISSTKSNVAQGSKDYTIYIMSNDVHTDLVFPMQSDLMDWTQVFPTSNNLGSADYHWVGIGWGDKGFYLNTPEWKDLTLKTAVVAAVGVGETALHVTYLSSVVEDKLCYKIEISKEQYQQLINHVLESLETEADNKAIYINTNAQYGDSDAFYEALGSYSMFYSCNTWANEGLKKANLPSGIWTVFDKGILRWYGY